MKNVLFGLAVGVVVGYVLRRMEDQGQFECLENELHGLTDKAKKKVKDAILQKNMHRSTKLKKYVTKWKTCCEIDVLWRLRHSRIA